MRVWAQITSSVKNDPSVGPTVGAQLALAVPRGIGAGQLYLAVQHDFTLKLLEGKLRPAIMSAIAAIPEAAGIEGFLVVVDPDAEPAIDTEPEETSFESDFAIEPVGVALLD